MRSTIQHTRQSSLRGPCNWGRRDVGGVRLLAWTVAAATAGRRRPAGCSRVRSALSDGAGRLSEGDDDAMASSSHQYERFQDYQMFESLRQNRFWSQSEALGLDLVSASPSLLRTFPQVYVILFGLDNSQQEGIYSLRALGPDGMPQDTIVAFESKDDAERYACLLEVTMDPHTPHVFLISPSELHDFSIEHGYRCRLESAGTLMIPPDYNVGLTDWERASKLRSGSYAVLNKDPETASTSAMADPLVWAGSQAVQAVHPGGAPAASGSSSSSSSSSSGSPHGTHHASGSGPLTIINHPLHQHQCQGEGAMGEDQLAVLRNHLEALLPSDRDT